MCVYRGEELTVNVFDCHCPYLTILGDGVKGKTCLTCNFQSKKIIDKKNKTSKNRSFPVRSKKEILQDKFKSRGLGDTIAWVLKTVHIQNLLKSKGCGCNSRQQKLNKLFPYRRGKFKGLVHATKTILRINKK